VNVLFDAGRMHLPSWDVTELPGYHALFALEPRLRATHGFRSRLRLSMDELARAEGLAGRMRQELSTKRAGYRSVCGGLLAELVVFLARCYSRMRRTEPQSLLRIGRTLSYLERHYAEDIRTEDLLRIAHMSGSSLLRAFRGATGTTPIAYLVRLRIRKAIELLRGGVTVTEAAHRVGFSDSNYFSRQFRKVMGTSPRAFLKRTRERVDGGGPIRRPHP
jgi:AraC-like DNA-binding protein